MWDTELRVRCDGKIIVLGVEDVSLRGTGRWRQAERERRGALQARNRWSRKGKEGGREGSVWMSNGLLLSLQSLFLISTPSSHSLSLFYPITSLSFHLSLDTHNLSLSSLIILPLIALCHNELNAIGLVWCD